MRAVSFKERRECHPSDLALPESERTYFTFKALSADENEHVDNVGHSVDLREQDGEAVAHYKSLIGTKAALTVRYGLLKVENLLGDDGQPIELAREHVQISGGERYKLDELARLPLEVRTWLSNEIAAASRLSKAERGKS